MKKRNTSLSISTEPLSPTAPVIFRGDFYEIVDTCKKIGYNGIELQMRNPDEIDGDAFAEYCAKNDMLISGIASGLEYSLNGLSMIHDDPEKRLLMREHLFKDVELAEKFGCPLIIGCVRGNIPVGENEEKYLARFREEMCILAEKAGEHGVYLVVEAINFYVNNYLNTIRQTCDFIDSLESPWVKLHIDTHHMIIEESDILGAVRYAGSRIGYVHFTENNRYYPGAGSFDFLSVLRVLDEVGYDDFITLEVVPYPDAQTCAENGFAAMQALYAQADLAPVQYSGDFLHC